MQNILTYCPWVIVALLLAYVCVRLYREWRRSNLPRDQR